MDDLYEDSEEGTEEPGISDPPLAEIAKIELTDPAARVELAAASDVAQISSSVAAALPVEPEAAKLEQIAPPPSAKANSTPLTSPALGASVATVKVNGTPPASLTSGAHSATAKTNGAQPAPPPPATSMAVRNSSAPAVPAVGKTNGALYAPPTVPVATPILKHNGAPPIPTTAEVKPATSIAAHEPAAVAEPFQETKLGARSALFSSELFVWFAGAIAIGATLGAIIVLLILSGINGSLFYSTATRGVQIEREQNQLSEQLTAVARDVAELQGQMVEINKLPSQVDSLNKNMDVAQKTLSSLTQVLESMDRSVKGHTQSLSDLNGDMEKAKTTLETLNQQMTQVSADMETVRGSAKQFDGFLGGLQNLLGNLVGKK